MSDLFLRKLEPFTRHLGGDEELGRAVTSFLKTTDGFDIDRLLSEVDETDYSAIDWAEALVEFGRWLDERKSIRRPFPDIVGYIHCCTLMNAPHVSLPSLKVIVSQSLTDYGFEAISTSQS